MPMTQGSDWRDIYARVQQTMLADDAVQNGTIYPRWIGDSDHFWYERSGEDGTEYRIIEARSGQSLTGFTRKAVADALSHHFGGPVAPETLMLRSLQIVDGLDRALFDAFGKSWDFHFGTGKLAEATKSVDRDCLMSPNGKRTAFTRDANLWIRDVETGEERALTTDGFALNSYGDPPGVTRYQRDHVGGRPEACWSPDSTRILTLRTDERSVLPLPYVDYAPQEGRRPIVHDNPTSLPGDPKVTEFCVLSIEVATGRQTLARYEPLAAVRMNDTLFAAGLTWWSADGGTAWFVDIERHERSAHVVAFDMVTGATRVVLTELAQTYIELSVNVYTAALVFPLPATNELIWYSERDGNGHLYLYDLNTGSLKNAITAGPWRVRDVQHVDQAKREIFFTAAGIAADEDPYICKPCIASIDGGNVRIVSAEPGEHLVWRPGEYGLIGPGFLGHDMFAIGGVAPSGNYFVETVGHVDALPITSLRRRTGELIAVLETAVDAGLPSGWSWPEPLKLKAADGKTDVYGLLFKPPNHDPKASYPIIDHIYGGPQISHVPKSAFAGGEVGGDYLAAASLAALGVFTLILDGRGTANRERAFREASYGAIHTASNIEDHVAALRQVSARDPSIDLTRAAITGFSGGGYMAAMAAVRFGDVFKVAVAGGGNYDQALFWHSWGERYHGAYAPEHYASQAVKTYADGLHGRLMLIHGLLDGGCHPAAVFQLVQALIDANKDVDLVILPQVAHEMTGYGERRRLDYFVTHLFGETPPSDVRLTTARDLINSLVKTNAEPPIRAEFPAGS
jgi:dipeptidyl-peptidase-4